MTWRTKEPWQKLTSGLFVPPYLKFAPGYPCCCGGCECSESAENVSWEIFYVNYSHLGTATLTWESGQFWRGVGAPAGVRTWDLVIQESDGQCVLRVVAAAAGSTCTWDDYNVSIPFNCCGEHIIISDYACFPGSCDECDIDITGICT